MTITKIEGYENLNDEQIQQREGVSFTVAYFEDFHPISDDARECEFNTIEDAECRMRNFDTDDLLAITTYDSDGCEYYRANPGVWERYA